MTFIAAAADTRLRALDSASGKTLWDAKLPAGGQATPSLYAVDGKQYVVIAAGGREGMGLAHAAADRHCGSRWARTLPRLRLRVPAWATSGATCGLSVTGAGRANPPQALAAVHLTCRTRVTPPLASGAVADDSSRSSATARCGATLRFPPCGCLGAVRSARPSIRMPAGNVALSLL
ncbi:hypothetical protein [Xanthomonas translucens]|uniref:hypothetical protein n=1 Tax=Xanthomonas campestris pv. translucens TaxID=343 RepID=UPI0002E6B665|nr:hypothetical protein [Xanthomonas translucens]MCT8284893.1 hypothetical protein [Xanthomonas translucens pv. translucens]MCT8302551.1 hypothetical protein [Xanthomonas translucens pv. translucens]